MHRIAAAVRHSRVGSGSNRTVLPVRRANGQVRTGNTAGRRFVHPREKIIGEPITLNGSQLAIHNQPCKRDGVMITADTLSRLARRIVNPEEHAGALEAARATSSITTAQRLCHFLGQVYVETAGFTAMEGKP
jgi:hypothetical protein